ncbi:MAG: amidohydrolase family protein [Cyclobacteriaceae bacterium]
MKNLSLLFNALVIAIAAGCQAKTQPAIDADVVFTNVNIIDVASGKVISAQDVFVNGERIVDISPTGKMRTTEDVIIIDGNGKYLSPGLAEMHAHIPIPQMGPNRVEETLLLYLTNGITTIRGMLGQPFHLELREKVSNGELLGPRIFTSSPSLNGNSMPDPVTARTIVTQYQQDGYDFLKIHPGIKREVFDTIVVVANEVGIGFAGHVPVDVGVRRAMEAKYLSIDHVDGFIEGLVPESEDVDPNTNGFFGVNFTNLADESGIPGLVAMSKEQGVWIVPTQSLFISVFSPLPTDSIMARPEMKYMSPSTRKQWYNTRSGFLQSVNEGAPAEDFLALRRKLILALHRSGQGLILGSDAPQVFNVPGFSIQRELLAMVEAGLTPLEALQIGTLNPARYFGEEDTFGQVSKGMSADLILLDANPIADITAMSQISGVMVRGKWLDRGFLDIELRKIEVRNR